MASIENSAKPRNGIVEFVRETRQEIKKVTWPNRKETIRLTTMVIVMALVTGLFFFLVDSAIGFLVSRLLGMHS